jgi:hypothetical protein
VKASPENEAFTLSALRFERRHRLSGGTDRAALEPDHCGTRSK